MCVLVVPEELKALQKAMEQEALLKKATEFSQRFDRYWETQRKDVLSLVQMEQVQDRSFLEMIRCQPIP